MKFTKKVRAATLGAAVAVMLSTAAIVSYAYDGTSDPVISLSYLKYYKQTEIDPQIASLNAQIASLEAQMRQLAQSSVGATANASTYEIVELHAGQRVIAVSSCDIMLRSGTATVVSPFAEQGISDYTDGVELLSGVAVPVNHMLLIPRGGDGRGIAITSDTAFIMVRGEYTLES